MTALSSCYGAVQEGFTELCQHWTQSGCSSGSSSEDSFRIRKKGGKNEQRSINFGRIEKHARTARVVPGPHSYGIIKCDTSGKWKGIPYIHGSQYFPEFGTSTDFEYNILERGLVCQHIL